MHRFNRRSRTMQVTSCFFSIGLVIAIGGQVRSSELPLPSGAKFEVVSVKVLGDKEAADRSPDFIGPNVAVRLRLSCSGSGFYFYTWRDDVTPHGYTVKLTDNGIVWLNMMPGHTDQPSSPGIEKLDTFVHGVWRLMSGQVRLAIECQVLDSASFGGEMHAFT